MCRLGSLPILGSREPAGAEGEPSRQASAERSGQGAAGTGRRAAGQGARPPGEASGGGVWVPSRGVASLKTNKGEDAEAGKPEMGKSAVIKESERFREGDRESARRRSRERNSVPCAQP